MTDLLLLQELLKDDAIITPEDGDYGKKSITLIEPETSSDKGYSVVIRNTPENTIAIKADKFPAPNAFFNNKKGECKRADFVMVSITPSDIHLIIIIEMKKGKGESETKIIQQLKGARCVVDYFRSIVKYFWQRNDFLGSNKYQYRFVSIRKIGIDKKPSRTRHANGTHDRPEQMLKITSPNYLEFNRLAR